MIRTRTVKYAFVSVIELVSGKSKGAVIIKATDPDAAMKIIREKGYLTEGLYEAKITMLTEIEFINQELELDRLYEADELKSRGFTK